MSFFSDPSFFVLTVAAVCGAAFLGLTERPLRRYGMGVSLIMLVCLFCKTPVQGAYAAAVMVVCCLAAQWLLRRPRSGRRFVACLLVTVAPLVVCKVTSAFSSSALGFIGISYLTFRAVQVLVETRDGLIERMNPFDYLYFLAFFPTFTSGPIDRSRRFVEDLGRVPSRDEYGQMLGRGILLVLCGMVYKMVLAAVVNQWNVQVAWGAGALGSAFGPALLDQVRICYAYGLYLFFDFAGYSMMAMGVGYALGVRVPRNFRSPFAAVDIKDFWNRWHITLSTWLRDFVFMRLARTMMRHHLFAGPKVPARVARLRTSQLALVTNMLIMGAWHGLTVDYLAYGLYHGVLLAALEGWEKTGFYKRHHQQAWYRTLSWFITMQLAFFGFALFSGQVSMLVKGALS